ncbi:PepSY domain-containing protein [Allosphingosinicella indica]|uniref:Peptidase propeptide and YPEB domain-containing protein n=1 Tax=Allosphingosinicella indica TaxID=941907 RepID=A0A1X7G1F3_9SPHN|nr:PepSY domain-containing protein [Allosphingosinicella indica]SMF61713.1 Peptidase propeptide and YPEB domain-containing protein [Allosphingosinicella indica]
MKPSLFIAAAAAALIATPALADRAPNAQERAAVEKVLRANGFVSWEEVELDDDGPRWEVDDARGKDNVRWDIKIDPKTMKIVKRERDD